MVVIITDDVDNASRENTRADANAAVARVEEKYDWGFIYLGAGEDAFKDGAGVMAGTKGVSMAYDKSNVRGMSRVYSAAISRKRAGGDLTLDPADASDDGSDDSSDGGPKVH